MDGKINDTPTNVLSTVPPRIAAGLDAGVSLFVCSVAGDNGVRPGTVPPDFWAHSLIFLVDPNTGATVTPTQLSSSGNFNLVAVVGNRGNAAAGRFNAPAAVKVDAARILLAIPAKSFARWFNEKMMEGFKRIEPSREWKLPFGECVVLQLVSDRNVIQIPALGEEYLAMSLGIEYSVKALKVGNVGEVMVAQATAVPIVNENKCYKTEYVTVGGFTIQVQAHDSKVVLKRKKK